MEHLKKLQSLQDDKTESNTSQKGKKNKERIQKDLSVLCLSSLVGMKNTELQASVYMK